MNTISYSTRNIIMVSVAAAINFFAASCTGSDRAGEEKAQAQQSNSYCVAIDLSDRIDDPATVEKDISSVMQAFSAFESQVRKARFMKSQDRFCVVLVPQSFQRNASELERLVSELSIDMRLINARERYKAFQDFSGQLRQRVRNIYQLARQPRLQDYAGCNVWGFLNNQLPGLLEASSGMRFCLVLLTDCYVEIDNRSDVFERSGKTNHMNGSVMARLRKDDYWQKSPCDILLLPERLTHCDLSKVSVVVAGLAARNPYPFETQLLEKVWSSFLSRIAVDYSLVGYSNSQDVIEKNLADALP